MKPQILVLDIETAPNLVYTWGLWQQDINFEMVEQTTYILCWAAKWLWSDNIRFSNLADNSETQMLTEIRDLLSQADIVVHFNGSAFDIPILNKSFIQHGIDPPSPFKQVDLYQVCKKVFKFQSTKLDSVTRELGLGKKVKHEGFELWRKCMDGDSEAFAKMKEYNIGDILLTEKLYYKLLPWIPKHPNLAAYSDRPACPNCGSSHVQSRGKEVAITKWYVRYHCQACGKWFRGEYLPRFVPSGDTEGLNN